MLEIAWAWEVPYPDFALRKIGLQAICKLRPVALSHPRMSGWPGGRPVQEASSRAIIENRLIFELTHCGARSQLSPCPQ